MVVAESGSRPPASRMRVTAAPSPRSPATWTPRAEVNENGTFALEGLVGVYSLRFENAPGGLDREIHHRQRTGRVRCSHRIPAGGSCLRPRRADRPRHAGQRQRAADPGHQGGTVVVFPDEPSKWTSSSRYVKTTRVGDDGRFSISGLPPHSRYLAVAIDFIEHGEAQNTEFLQRAKAAATSSFGLTAGGQQVLDLPLSCDEQDACAVVLAIVLAAIDASGQTPGQSPARPQRDVPNRRSAAGLIAGRVTAADTGVPLRQAVVAVTSVRGFPREVSPTMRDASSCGPRARPVADHHHT